MTADPDAARLVYADWLKERDDPRSAFLRAEVAPVSSTPGEFGLGATLLCRASRGSILAVSILAGLRKVRACRPAINNKTLLTPAQAFRTPVRRTP